MRFQRVASSNAERILNTVFEKKIDRAKENVCIFVGCVCEREREREREKTRVHVCVCVCVCVCDVVGVCLCTCKGVAHHIAIKCIVVIATECHLETCASSRKLTRCCQLTRAVLSNT